MKPVRVAIVGVRRGAAHIEPLRSHEQCEVVVVCDLRADRAQAVAQRYGIDRVLPDYAAVLSDPQVNAVCIATPDHLHGEMTVQALSAGKHVLCEIPLATTLEHCRQLVELSRARNLKVQMGNECRWMPYLQAVKGLIEQGQFGRLFYGEAEYLHNLLLDGSRVQEEDGSRHWRWDPAHPQTTLLGGGPHALDTLRWLLGVDQFQEVVAFGTQGSINLTPADDTTVALYRSRDGVLAKITVSYGMHRPYCLYYSCYGTDGSFEASRDTPQGPGRVFLKSIRHQTGMMELPVPLWQHPRQRAGAGHGTTEYYQDRDFVDAILEDRDPFINAREGAISCAAGICGLEAARTRQRVAIPQF